MAESKVIDRVGDLASARKVAAVLGILKSGHAYLPLDPALPPARLQMMLDDAQVSCTVQLTGRIAEIDDFVERAAAIGKVAAVARSGSVAVSKGEVTLSSYARHHRLTG